MGGEIPSTGPHAKYWICRVSTVVVQRFCKPKVGGSNPSPGTILERPVLSRRGAGATEQRHFSDFVRYATRFGDARGLPVIAGRVVSSRCRSAAISAAGRGRLMK
jgi:hypothetical protein